MRLKISSALFSSVGQVAVLMAAMTAAQGCSTLFPHSPKAVPVSVANQVGDLIPEKAPADYRIAVRSLNAQDFKLARIQFTQFMQQNPASPWTQAAMLNTGRALEGEKRWQDAANRYHQVVAATTRAPSLQATALYRLSFCHEALGDDPQVVVDLNDLYLRSSALPPEVAQGELPARLAAAYARVGNFDRAQEFYRRAETGIAKLRQASGTKIPEWLPKTLYLMGESASRRVTWTDFEPALRSFARSQVYLLEAAELNQVPWSGKSADELILVYETLMTTIEGAPIPEGDPVISKRALQQMQWRRAGQLVDLLVELRARILPNSKSPAAPKAKILSSLSGIDHRINSLLNDRPAGEGLTESALSRKNSGRTLPSLSTDDTLEQQFLKSSREAKPGLSLVPAPKANPARLQDLKTDALPEMPQPIHSVPEQPTTEDPNL